MRILPCWLLTSRSDGMRPAPPFRWQSSGACAVAIRLAHRPAAIGSGCACTAPPGAELVAHLLARAAPRHLAPSLLRAAGELARAAAPAPGLASALARCLLLDVRLWARAPLPTQRVLVQTMLAHAKARAAAARNINPKPNLGPNIRA